MTPTMLRAMGKSLLDQVAEEQAHWEERGREIPSHRITALMVLTGLGKAWNAGAEAAEEGSNPQIIRANKDEVDREEYYTRRWSTTKEVTDSSFGMTTDSSFGMTTGTLGTYSENIRHVAASLRFLANHGRFRIVGDTGGNTVFGYWPENDPQNTKANPESVHG